MTQAQVYECLLVILAWLLLLMRASATCFNESLLYSHSLNESLLFVLFGEGQLVITMFGANTSFTDWGISGLLH